MVILKRSFYTRDTTLVAQELLGKIIVRAINNQITLKVKIVETEAYLGMSDPASHAYGGMRVRNAPMYGPQGHAYVYFTYGMYHCLNFVAREKSVPAGGVLIRAVEPMEGIKYMEKIRHHHATHGLTNGPGKLTQALAINRDLNGIDVAKKGPLYVEDASLVTNKDIVHTTRIGISKAKNDILRFYIKDNPFVSKY